MKRLYLIGGTMGVGKTTVCQNLKRSLPNAVFLDGDWCWDADPFHVTDETKAMVLDNICHLLNNFIRCTAYENIVFCWMMHQQGILDGILARLDREECEIKAISLVCTAGALSERLRRDIQAGVRQPGAVARSLERLPLYDTLDTIHIDTSGLSPEETAARIASL